LGVRYPKMSKDIVNHFVVAIDAFKD